MAGAGLGGQRRTGFAASPGDRDLGGPVLTRLIYRRGLTAWCVL